MVFPQLEVLSLMDVHFPDMEAVLQNMNGMLCPRLAKLYLHYNNGGFPLEYQYQLLMACPSLVAFHWTLPNGNEKHVFAGGFRDLCEFYHPERYRETEELHIVGEMDDYAIALAMNVMKGVKSLSLCVDNRIGIASLYAIRNMAANLRRFESHSYLMTCATIETILSSCPLLHTMIARTMSALYATKEKRREWICAPSLKVLCLSFVFESHEAHLQDEMYEKLARLTQLEHLIMNEPCDDRPGRFGLRLRLDQGLGRLSTLKNLTFLSTLDDFSHPCRMQELAWMGKHWPLLREYHCAPSGRSVIHNK
ncbi:hypothetical protein BGZ68_008933 [Mortierella alpina]|nr:hypothetical protein BGZ68_008933 [Mortierella alpina]